MPTPRFPAKLDLEDAGNVLLSMRTGHDYGVAFQFFLSDGVTAENLSGRSFRFVMRPSVDSARVILSGTSSDAVGVGGLPSIDLSNAVSGKLGLNIPGSRTAAIQVGRYVYAVVETTSGKVESFVEGSLVVTQGAGRS